MEVPVPAQVANLLNEETPQIYAACGRGSRSTLRVLRPGLAVTELAVWPLPGAPTAVWTLKRSQQDELDAYIVVSFDNATLVRARSSNAGNLPLSTAYNQGLLMTRTTSPNLPLRTTSRTSRLVASAERMDCIEFYTSARVAEVCYFICRCCPSARRWRR